MFTYSNVDIVEKGTVFPIHFRLDKGAIGLTDWKAELLDIHSDRIIPVSDLVITEMGEFLKVGIIQGFHEAGTWRIKLDDTGSLTVGNQVRIVNMVFSIVDIEGTNHIVTLDRAIPVDINDAVPIKLVQNPSFLGIYKIEVPMEHLGQFLLTVTEVGKGIVNPIDNRVEVIVSMSSLAGIDGKLNSVSNDAL